MSDIILDAGPDFVSVVAPPESVRVSYEIGQTGQRGSQWFTGNGLPGPATLPDLDFNINDLYFDTSTSSIYQYILLPNNVGDWVFIGKGGAAGPKGDKGDTGDTGPANELSIGSVTTGAVGSNAVATITGTTPNQVLDLTLPRGSMGPAGSPVATYNSFNLTNIGWVKLATFTAASRYGTAQMRAAGVGYSVNSSDISVDIRMLVRQESAFGANPRVWLQVDGMHGTSPIADRFKAVLIQNTGPTIVELYYRFAFAYDGFTLSPSLISGAVELHHVPPVLADLPAGEQFPPVWNSPADLVGTGMPNGVVTARPGTYYTDTAGTNGAWRWLKKSGTGNTGWDVVHGDTGWRKIAGWTSGVLDYGTMPTGLAPKAGATGGVYIRRNGSSVTGAVVGGTSAAVLVVIQLASGFKGDNSIIPHHTGSESGRSRVTSQWFLPVNTGADLPNSADALAKLTVSFNTADPWPTTLPGTPA